MILSDMMQEKNISQYRLSKESGVGQATISDLCSGKSSLDKCAAGTLYKLAKVLNTTVEEMIEAEAASSAVEQRNESFETFRGNVCHRVKDLGDIDFIVETLEKDDIRHYYKLKKYAESLYILAMVDYLSRLNEIPLCSKYNDIRNMKLSRPVYTSDVNLQSAIMGTDEYKEKARENAIPEFLQFNIVEGGVRDVV